MSPADEDGLIAALRESGIAWWIAEDTPERVKQVAEEATLITAEFRDKFPIESRALGDLVERMVLDQQKLMPFIQTFAAAMSIPFRALVLAVVLGANVMAITASYEYRRVAELTVRVEFPSGEKATFASKDLWDYEVLRHFGLMKMGDLPVIDGYYAFRKSAS